VKNLLHLRSEGLFFSPKFNLCPPRGGADHVLEQQPEATAPFEDSLRAPIPFADDQRISGDLTFSLVRDNVYSAAFFRGILSCTAR